MNNFQNILINGISYGLVIKKNFRTDGINFFTKDEMPFQIGYMNREKNYIIPPHLHNTVSRNVSVMSEVLFIKSGKVRVDFYDITKKYLGSFILEEGDFILLTNGGHGFEMIEKSEIIEIKQGPYLSENDKTRFNLPTDFTLKYL